MTLTRIDIQYDANDVPDVTYYFTDTEGQPFSAAEFTEGSGTKIALLKIEKLIRGLKDGRL